MYKSRLQELCQQKKWELPDYVTAKEGPDHNPRFHSTVTLNGLSFASPSSAKSSKDAQNLAAKLAFHHFSLPPPTTTTTTNNNTTTNIAAAAVTAAPVPGDVKPPETPQSTPATSSPVLPPNDERCEISDTRHWYKNELQSYAQKRNLTLPAYSSHRLGPPHAPRFMCEVTLSGQTFAAQDFFPTLNEAEHAAAKAALMSLLPQGIEEDDSRYKNLLQELSQKDGQQLPTYDTTRSGDAHRPSFVSSVEVDGEIFLGQTAKTKKQAEMSAAKVAYLALKQRKINHSPSCLSPAHQGQEALQFSSPSLRSDLTAYLQRNVQPKLPSPSELADENIGSEGSSDINRVASSFHPSVSYSPEHGSSTSSQHSANLVISSTIERLIKMSALNTKRIVVHPRKAKVTYPAGSTVLPMSDDNWVAVEILPQSSQ